MRKKPFDPTQIKKQPTLEDCIKDALRYDSIYGWHSDKSSLYQTAFRRGWLKTCSIQCDLIRAKNAKD